MPIHGLIKNLSEGRIKVSRAIGDLSNELGEFGITIAALLTCLEELSVKSVDEMELLEKTRAFWLKRLHKGDKLFDALREFLKDGDKPIAKVLRLHVSRKDEE